MTFNQIVWTVFVAGAFWKLGELVIDVAFTVLKVILCVVKNAWRASKPPKADV